MRTERGRARRWIMAILCAAAIIYYIFRLMQIQIVDADAIKSQHYSLATTIQTVKATRGEIVESGGAPLVINEMGYNVVIDYAFFPKQQWNDIILRLIGHFERLGEEYTDNLPLSRSAPFVFYDGHEKAIEGLKKAVGVQSWATSEHVMHGLIEKYKLEDYSISDARKIAGVRYEMEMRDFSAQYLYTFASGISVESVVAIKEHSYELAGVDVVESAVRSYVGGNLMPHIIGSIGPIYAEEKDLLVKKGYSYDDIVGKSGVESAFEDILRGKDGQRQILVAATGEVVEAKLSSPPIPGNTVVLTIDSKMQALAQQALVDQIRYLNATAPVGQGREADAGSVVVLRPKTGEILALATYPTYDLQTYKNDYASLANDTEGAPLLNRAVAGQYTPGSIFKPCVGLAGYRDGLIDVNSTVNCTSVYNYFQGTHRFTCLGVHNNVNITSALAQSCNIFFYDTGRRVGIERLNEMVTQLGLGQPTGIEIDEKIGQISSPETKKETWYEGDVLQTSIGQLLNRYTPLQLANYVATIANRGDHMNVTLVKEIRDYSRKNIIEPSKPVVANVVDAPPEAFEGVIGGMVAASRTGTARSHFAAYPYDVASKTGTPETTDLPNSTFICFAPAQDPEIAIAVVIEKGWHGYTGAPVAKRLLNYQFGVNDPTAMERMFADQQDIASSLAAVEAASGAQSDATSDAESSAEVDE